MEQTRNAENLWRGGGGDPPPPPPFFWGGGGQPLGVRRRGGVFSCVEQYTGMQYRYQ